MRIFEHNFVAGKYFSRRMQQNLPKRHLYTLVKTGSKARFQNHRKQNVLLYAIGTAARFSICTEMCFVFTSSWCGLPRSAWRCRF